MLTGARVRGAGMSAVYALQRLAFSQLLAGQWRALRSSADEALTLARGVGQQALTAAPLAWLTLLAALQGAADYENLLADLEEVVATHRLGHLDRPGARPDPLGEGSPRHRSRGHVRRTAPPEPDAASRPDPDGSTGPRRTAVRAGDAVQAAAWTGELAPFAEATQWPWALASVTYGRAMTADPADAPGLFETALARYRSANRP